MGNKRRRRHIACMVRLTFPTYDIEVSRSYFADRLQLLFCVPFIELSGLSPTSPTLVPSVRQSAFEIVCCRELTIFVRWRQPPHHTVDEVLMTKGIPGGLGTVGIVRMVQVGLHFLPSDTNRHSNHVWYRRKFRMQYPPSLH